MATQSIIKNIVINEQTAAEMFISALEKAANAAEKSISHNIEAEDISKEDLKKYFGVIRR